MTTVFMEVEVDLSDIDTVHLVREIQSRADIQSRDWDLLADMIAKAETKDALYLLAKLSPVPISPTSVLRIAEARAA